MKAKYQSPQLYFEALEEEEMIASSLRTDESGNPYQTLNDAPTTDDVSGNLSRLNIWEDDEY